MTKNISLTLIVAWVLIGGAVVGIVFVEVGDELERDIENCEAVGGEQTVYGGLLYCEFDNGTGRKLGTGERPHELDYDVADRRPPGMVHLFPVAAGCGVVAVGVIVVQRYRN